MDLEQQLTPAQNEMEHATRTVYIVYEIMSEEKRE